MRGLLPLLPFVLIIGSVLCGRNAILASALGVVSCLLIGLLAGFHMSASTIGPITQRTVVLTLEVASVVVPGIYYNLVLKNLGTLNTIAEAIDRIDMPKERKALIIVLGLAPFVESMTGFGVSLLLTVPIMFHLFEAAKAFRLSMLSMNIMPWGTLALATVIGAALTSHTVRELGVATSVTSFPVFPGLGLAVLLVAGGETAVRKHWAFAVLLGLIVSSLLVLNNKWLVPQTAGVFSGLGVCTLGVALHRIGKTNQDGRGESLRHCFRAMEPYWVLLFTLIVLRVCAVLWIRGAIGTTWATGGEVLTNPGTALAINALGLQFRHRIYVRPVGAIVISAKPVLTVFLLLGLAQLMQTNGMLEALADKLSVVSKAGVCFLVPALGLMSGQATGSNVGGNALMMPLQSRVGREVGGGLILTAAQNSAAGHAVFASMPIILLISSIAEQQPQIKTHSTRSMLRFGMKMLCVIYALLVGWLLFITAWQK
jgi:lactate permease